MIKKVYISLSIILIMMILGYISYYLYLNTQYNKYIPEQLENYNDIDIDLFSIYEYNYIKFLYPSSWINLDDTSTESYNSITIYPNKDNQPKGIISFNTFPYDENEKDYLIMDSIMLTNIFYKFVEAYDENSLQSSNSFFIEDTLHNKDVRIAYDELQSATSDDAFKYITYSWITDDNQRAILSIQLLDSDQYTDEDYLDVILSSIQIK